MSLQLECFDIVWSKLSYLFAPGCWDCMVEVVLLVHRLPFSYRLLRNAPLLHLFGARPEKMQDLAPQSKEADSTVAILQAEDLLG